MSVGLLSPPLEDADHVAGTAEAPFELVMFGDFQCPYCLAAQSVLRRVRERLGDDLRFAFRHLPIVAKHPFAQMAAEASEAAAARGRFWEFHDAVYPVQQRLSEDEILGVAESVGLDRDEVARELGERRWRDRVERDVRSAEASGAHGTPTFFVNGRLHEDVYDAGTLVAALRTFEP